MRIYLYDGIVASSGMWIVLSWDGSEVINSVLCIWEDRAGLNKPGKARTDGVGQGLGLIIIEPAFSHIWEHFWIKATFLTDSMSMDWEAKYEVWEGLGLIIIEPAFSHVWEHLWIKDIFSKYWEAKNEVWKGHGLIIIEAAFSHLWENFWIKFMLQQSLLGKIIIEAAFSHSCKHFWTKFMLQQSLLG